ncbi:hypothetical protein QWZ08_17045 [Ferruginibacter paludis]|uniref:hypothetical protein n=1 Tax=Ferruginibacter paludis TaxID=1310417 RepID=UPI0025B5C9AD|nr:hypothetical protein [Ferruginibacter paludis]MDN3657361.1 hypothetical protein [Ferruginibacter paludis]
MKSSIFLFLSIVLYCQLQAQNSKRFSLEVNYGLNGNFFVRSYDETEGPANKTNFYNKNFLGTVGGIEMNYHLNDHSSLIGGYSRSTNAGEKNYSGNVNGVNLFIKDFNIRHSNDFYQLGYERRFNKSNPMLKYHFGVVYATMHQQEISVENFANDIIVEERNFKNSRLEEGGIFGGVHFQKKIDTKFELGIRVRAYYLISAQTLEAVTFTPTLTYLF